MIAACIAVLLAVVAQLGDPELEAAARAYEAGRFEEALVRYDSALDGPERPRGAVLFNMGNCAYRLERFAEAVLFYRRAELRLPDDAEVAVNRRLAERQLGLDADRQATSADPDGLALPVAAVAVAFLQGLGLWLVLRGRSVRSRLLAPILVVAGLVGGVAVVRDAFAPPAVLGVVLEDDVAVHREPHVDLPALFALQAGETVRVEEMSDRWMRITHPRGHGWVACAGVSVVD